MEYLIQNSLEFQCHYIMQMLLSLLGKKNEEQDKKGTESLIWGRGSEKLGKDRRGRDDKFTNVACHYFSSVPSPMLGALERNMRREKGKICNQSVVELRHHEWEAEHMCCLYNSYLAFVCTFNFSKHARIQAQITCL